MRGLAAGHLSGSTRGQKFTQGCVSLTGELTRTHSAIGDLTSMECINYHHNQPQAAQELTSLVMV